MFQCPNIQVVPVTSSSRCSLGHTCLLFPAVLACVQEPTCNNQAAVKLSRAALWATFEQRRPAASASQHGTAYNTNAVLTATPVNNIRLPWPCVTNVTVCRDRSAPLRFSLIQVQCTCLCVSLGEEAGSLALRQPHEWPCCGVGHCDESPALQVSSYEAGCEAAVAQLHTHQLLLQQLVVPAAEQHQGTCKQGKQGKQDTQGKQGTHTRTGVSLTVYLVAIPRRK